MTPDTNILLLLPPLSQSHVVNDYTIKSQEATLYLNGLKDIPRSKISYQQEQITREREQIKDGLRYREDDRSHHQTANPLPAMIPSIDVSSTGTITPIVTSTTSSLRLNLNSGESIPSPPLSISSFSSPSPKSGKYNVLHQISPKQQECQQVADYDLSKHITANKSPSSECGSESPEASVGQSHKVAGRSRIGCLTCKFRKRKCSELKPICKECRKLKIKCNWSQNDSLLNKNRSRKKDKSFMKIDEVKLTNEFGGFIVKVVRAKVDYKIENGVLISGELDDQ